METTEYIQVIFRVYDPFSSTITVDESQFVTLIKLINSSVKMRVERRHKIETNAKFIIRKIKAP